MWWGEDRGSRDRREREARFRVKEESRLTGQEGEPLPEVRPDVCSAEGAAVLLHDLICAREREPSGDTSKNQPEHVVNTYITRGGNVVNIFIRQPREHIREELCSFVEEQMHTTTDLLLNGHNPRH